MLTPHLPTLTHPFIVSGLLLVALAGHHYWARLHRVMRACWWSICIAASGVLLANIVQIVLRRTRVPAEWDFMTFWLGARVAVQRLDFYDPAAYATQVKSLPLTPDMAFVEEILQVGYAYPPWSMLLMAPFGWLEFSTAFFVWSALSTLAMVTAMALLFRKFFPQRASHDLGLVLLLVLLFPATWQTFELGQSNLFLLCGFILIWTARERVSSGLALALTAVAKPLPVLLLPWFAVRRHFKAFAVAIGGLLVLLLLSALAFGPDVVASYFTEGVVGRFPLSVYTQPNNQSALAWALRHFGPPAAGAPVMFFPPYLILAALIGVGTLAAVLRGTGSRTEWSLGATLVAALLVYPSSLQHYSLALLLPLIALWTRREQLPFGVWGTIVLFPLVYVLSRYTDREGAVLAYAGLWLVLVTLSVRISPSSPAP